jgi:putative oxidoreductase
LCYAWSDPYGTPAEWFFHELAGQQQGEGFEYHLLAMAISVALMIKGGGRWSIDGLLTKKE